MNVKSSSLNLLAAFLGPVMLGSLVMLILLEEADLVLLGTGFNAVFGFAGLVITFLGRRSAAAVERARLPAAMTLVGLAWLAVYQLAHHDLANFFLHWPPREWIFKSLQSVPPRVLVLAAIFAPLLMIKKVPTWAWMLGLYLFGLSMCLDGLADGTDWRPLYRDDHATFMSRIHDLDQVFPRTMYWTPFWNAGFENISTLATGAVIPAFLALPLVKLVGFPEAYTPMLAYLYIGLVPLFILASCRMMGLSWTGSLFGASLALGLSREYYRWLIHFGTLGGALSSALLPVTAGALYRVLVLKDRRWFMFGAFILSGWLMLTWPLAIVPAGLLVVAAACVLPGHADKRTLLFVGIAGAVLAVLCVPSLIALSQSATVKTLSGMEAVRPPLSELASHGWEAMWERLCTAHPMLLIPGMAGSFLVLRGTGGRFWGIMLVGLVLFMGWGELWKPGLEFSRMDGFVVCMLVLPSSLLAEELFKDRRWLTAPARGLVIGLVALGSVSMLRLYENKDPEAFYRLMPDEVYELAAFAREEIPEGGRLLFAGISMHGYGGAHVAFLPTMSGREMMAADFYHFSPKVVEYDYPPRAFRQDAYSIAQFFELYNVTHTVTYHDNWIRFFRKYSDQYEEVRTIESKHPKVVFRVKRSPNMFHKGQGEVSADLNRITLSVGDTDADVVLKYNYSKRFKASGNAELFPYDAGNDVQLLGVRPNGSREVKIRFSRIF